MPWNLRIPWLFFRKQKVAIASGNRHRVEYTYSTGDWGDLLTSHDGNTITSDAIGNMLTYGNSKTFTWEHGRELSGMTDASGNWSFAYNADGLRVYRSNGTATYKYYYSGDKLSRMVVNGEDITFGYDANGAPQYVIYGGHRYFYLTNLQGDVTAIITVGGTTVVEYTYDAWGNILTVTGSMADTLGKANPLRYRGYVYDDETRLYYLQSRYYDPEIGRFINSDVYTSTGQGLLSNNMFAYCLNNPVCYLDSTGYIATSAFSTAAYATGGDQSIIQEILEHITTISEDNITSSVGITGFASYFGSGAGGSLAVGVDSSYNYAGLRSINFGVGSSLGASAMVGINFQLTNADVVTDLEGVSKSYGFTAAALCGIAIDIVQFIPASNPDTTCWGVSVTIGLGMGADIHASQSNTSTKKTWNPVRALCK